MTKTVLVTGASGFLAGYVIKDFLEAGWAVRGTVRSPAKSQHILDRYPKGSKLELVEVKDIVTGEGLSSALEGVDAVAHTASPYSLSVTDPMKDFISPAVDGTLSVLKAAKAAGIKRVVVTSSFAAVTDFTKGGPWRDYTYTGEDWNPTTLEQACEPGRIGAFVYSASKKLAEKAALEYGEKEGLEVITMNPPMIYGPPIQAMDKREDINTSSAAIYALIDGPADRPVPDNRLPLFCAVTDVAKAHRLALEVPAAQGRYILCGGAFTWEDAVEYIAQERPELASRLPKLPETKAPRKTIATLDTTPAKEVLGLKEFVKWKAILLETLDALVEKEKQW
ncbi:NAD-dependent epimerase/dehydratase [Pseudohyphozyma bogoriensis]|nr:NAD-dependent epimerase/dehydratase [Pseudohyphozyma bogoriensis]